MSDSENGRGDTMRVRTGFGAFCVFFWGLSAWATSFVERPFPETIQGAEAIVRGRVGMSYADWAQDPGDERRIYTFIEIDVQESLKGNLPTGRALVTRAQV